MHRIVLATLCVLIGTGAVPDPQAGGPSAAREALGSGALAKELADQHDSLTALSLVYQQEPTSAPGKPTGAYMRRLVAASRPGFFLRDNGHGHDRMRLSEDPYRKILLITPTESTLLEYLNRVMAEVDMRHSGHAPDDLRNELIFQALCWWPFVNWSAPEVYGRLWSMSSLLKGGAYSLRPQTEAVGSRPCYVLEVKGIDVIWVDCERPRCVLRRDIYNPATRSVAARFEMTDYRDAGEGIWLPGRLRNRQFDSNSHTPSLRARVVVDSTFLIHDIKVNGAVEPGTFRLDLGPGTVRRMVSHGEERFEPVRDGQTEHFQSILAWSRKNARWPEASAARPAARVWVFAAAGMAVGGLAVALARRPSARQARPAGVAGRSGVD
jgi:hypothetical protein